MEIFVPCGCLFACLPPFSGRRGRMRGPGGLVRPRPAADVPDAAICAGPGLNTDDEGPGDGAPVKGTGNGNQLQECLCGGLRPHL